MPGLPQDALLGMEAAVALAAAEEAGAVLRRLFRAGAPAETKGGGELVCEADREVDALLRARLADAFPKDALLTEEAPDDRTRLNAPRVWIVDPLDGTRDFLQGSPEFAVHVGLAEEGAPTLGVIHGPVSRRTWLGIPGVGAWVRDRGGAWTPTGVTPAPRPIRVAVARRHMGPGMRVFRRHLPRHLLVRCGSSGLKAALIAEGRCDLYAAVTRRMKEWDLCAPHALVAAAGGCCTDLRGCPLSYNREDVGVPTGFLVTTPGLLERLRPTLDAAALQIPWLAREI